MEKIHLIENKIITKPEVSHLGGDAITVFGPGHPSSVAEKTLIRNCIINFLGVPAKEQDEAISGVHGAVVECENVVIMGSIKAFLCGNGDYPKVDKERARWKMRNVAMLGCGRRCPEAQHGTEVDMEYCLVENWGEVFDVRSFGAWAHLGAYIEARNCLFIQNKKANNLWQLIAGFCSHFGQAWNDMPSNTRDYFSLGNYRGATASRDGKIKLVNCYTNNPRIRLDGHEGPRATMCEGIKMLNRMRLAFLHLPDPMYISRHYPNSVLFKGLSSCPKDL